MTTRKSREQLAQRVSLALASVAALTAATSFIFWQLFERDVPAVVGNLRGTALAILVVAVPLLLLSIQAAANGSVRAQFIWLGSLAYLAYNAVLLCFAAHFNSLFFLDAAFLALSFWALVTTSRTIDSDVVRMQAVRVPARAIAIYLIASCAAFAALWLAAIVPAIVNNNMPPVIVESGVTQNAVWVLDFAFTFPLMLIGAVRLWRRDGWGYVIGGTMVIMLTIETASIAIDQLFGHLHDSAAPLSAIPVMVGFTLAGVLCAVWFLRRVSPVRVRGLGVDRRSGVLALKS